MVFGGKSYGVPTAIIIVSSIEMSDNVMIHEVCQAKRDHTAPDGIVVKQ